MNTIFKIIWNHASQSFVVASELAKGYTKSSVRSTRRVFNLTRIGAALSLVLGSSAVMASLPVSGTGTTCVVDGVTVACVNGSQAVTRGSIAIGENAIAGMADLNGAKGEKLPSTNIEYTAELNKLGSRSAEYSTRVGKENNIAIGSGAEAVGGRNISVGQNAGAQIKDNWNINNINMGNAAAIRSSGRDNVFMGRNAGGVQFDSSSQTLSSVGADKKGLQGDGNVVLGVNAGAEAGAKSTNKFGFNLVDMNWNSGINNSFTQQGGTNVNVLIGMEAGAKLDAVSSSNVFIGQYAGRNFSSIIASKEGLNYKKSDGTLANPYSPVASGINVGIGGNSLEDAAGEMNVAMGWKSGQKLMGSNNTSIGYRTLQFSHGDGNTAIGPGAGAGNADKPITEAGDNLYSSQSISVGSYARGYGNSSIAMGNEAEAGIRELPGVVDKGIAIGMNALTTGQASGNIGNYTWTQKHQKQGGVFASTSYAVGNGNLITDTNRTENSMVTPFDAFAFGNSNIINAQKGIAVGNSNIINAQKGIAVGNSNNVSGEQSMAIGINAQAKAQDSIAQGTEAKAYGESNIAIGKNARSGRGKKGFSTSLADEPEANSIAIGNNAQAPNQSSIAMGDGATVQYFAPDAIAIGTNAKVGTYARTSIAIGKEATAKHFYNTAIGPQTVTDGVGAAAVGFSAQALGIASFAAGQGAKAENHATVAIGENAKATIVDNVSLGSRAIDRQAVQINDTTVQGVSYSGFAGKAKAVVSVGAKNAERQIINVAPGEISKTSTDAINGSQLYLVAEGLTNQRPVVYTNKDGNKVYKKPDGTFVDGKGNPVQSADVVASMNNPDNTTTNPTTLTNIAGNLPGAKPGTTAPTNAGTVPTDVKANNAATVGDVLNAGWNLQGNSSAVDFVKPYDTVNFINGANTSVSVTTADNLTNEVRVNVTGLPISYTNNKGDTLVKVGDNFYKASDVVNGKPIDNAEAQTPAGTTLVDDSGAAAPQTLDNVKSAINPDGSKTGDTFINALNDAAASDPNKAVNVSDLKNVSDNIRKATVAAKTTVTSKNGTITVVKTTDDTTKADNYDLSINAQGVTNNAQLPVVYTNKKGEKVYKQEDGTFNTAIDGKGTTVQPDDVIASMNNGSDNTGPTQLANVDSAINGQDGQDFVEKLKNASADDIAKNSAVNVSDLQNTTDALTQKGFGLTDDNGDVVKKPLGDTLKVNGQDGITVTANKDSDGLNIGLGNDLSVGKDGKEGSIGVNGADGKPAVAINGKDGGSVVVGGKDGQPGIALNGKEGSMGIAGKDGANADITTSKGEAFLGGKGDDGKDSENGTRITYQPKDQSGNPVGDPKQVATMDDGLSFAGDKGEVINKKLNEQLDIKGNVAPDAEVTDKNIRVDSEQGALIIKMAKMLQDLEGAIFEKDGQTLKVENGGIVIVGKNDAGENKTVKLNANGLDNGGNKITNVGRGTDKTDAVNVEQLEEVKTQAGAGGFNVATNGEGAKKIGNGDTVDFVNGNNTVVSKVDGAKGTKVKVDLAKDLKGLNSVELKDQAGNTTNVTGNGVSITGTNAAGKPSNVSLTANGLDNGGNRITNVAPGVKGTDAVNVNQLKAVGNRIGDVDRKARGGIAGSTAMANLPQAYIPGHSMVAVAAGTHRGANAVAVGVSRISDSGHVIIKLSGSTDSKGGTNAGVGVGYQW